MKVPFTSLRIFRIRHSNSAQVRNEAQQALAVDLTNTEMLLTLGVAFYELGNHAQAVEALHKNVDLLTQRGMSDGSNLSMYAYGQYWLGCALASANHIEEAHTAWNISLDAYKRLIPDDRRRRRIREVKSIHTLMDGK